MAYADPHDERAKEARRRHYRAHKTVYKARAVARKARLKAWLSEMKESEPCMDCGESYPACVMDFDHRPGEGKSFEMSRANEWGEQAILDEIEKCDLVCSNCHRIRTHILRAGQ